MTTNFRLRCLRLVQVRANVAELRLLEYKEKTFTDIPQP